MHALSKNNSIRIKVTTSLIQILIPKKQRWVPRKRKVCPTHALHVLAVSITNSLDISRVDIGSYMGSILWPY